MKKLVIVAILIMSGFVFPQDHHDHSKNEEEHGDHGDDEHRSSKKVGKGKAIEQIDEEKGFKLSKEAIKTMGLNFKILSKGQSEFEIKKATLVTSREFKGVYRYRLGFFKLLEVQILKGTRSGYKVKVKEIKHDDQVVVSSVGLLRVADLYSTDESEYEHAH